MHDDIATQTARIPAAAVADVAPDGHVYNARGIIAENYHDLQGLGVLSRARDEHPIDRATPRSTLRAVYQAVEIGLLNLADITVRASSDLDDGRNGRALVKMHWARGFHRVLLRLSTLPHLLGLPLPTQDTTGRLRVSESPAFREYLSALHRLDHTLDARVDSGELPLDEVLAAQSIDSVELALVHVTRICNHESTIWEHNLAELRIPAPAESWDDFVVAGTMREAVYDRVLTGDTYFTQFRGLHQIPETLGEEVNDHTEQAIRDIRAGGFRAAFEHLRCATILSDGMLAALAPMADNLATSDYHEIRENLGLTSGSHSVCLRFHLFSDLYKQLWEAMETAASRAAAPHGVAAGDAIGFVDARRDEDGDTWLLHLLMGQCLALRTFVHQWREQHLHMPRNNLGGGYTKSLTGSPDAILAVKKMRNAADAADVMQPLARLRGLPEGRPAATHPLATYLESDVSLDGRILTATGRVTQHRFQQVQERLGIFAQKCPFVPPQPRRV